MGFLGWLTKTGLRVGLVAGAIKISLDQDVWTLNTEKGNKLYDEFSKNIVNGTVVYKEKLPSCEEVQSEVGSKWNQKVNCAFKCINAAPETAKVKLVSLYTKYIPREES